MVKFHMTLITFSNEDVSSVGKVGFTLKLLSLEYP